MRLCELQYQKFGLNLLNAARPTFFIECKRVHLVCIKCDVPAAMFLR